jgi:hypothetical protein
MSEDAFQSRMFVLLGERLHAQLRLIEALHGEVEQLKGRVGVLEAYLATAKD